jgi:hypothetical protein
MCTVVSMTPLGHVLVMMLGKLDRQATITTAVTMPVAYAIAPLRTAARGLLHDVPRL